jgi:hypothetical protein
MITTALECSRPLSVGEGSGGCGSTIGMASPGLAVIFVASIDAVDELQ